MTSTITAIAATTEVKEPENYRKEKAKLESINTIKSSRSSMFLHKKERSKYGDFSFIKRYIEVNAKKFIDEKYVLLSEVYKDYMKWSNIQGDTIYSEHKFTNGLIKMGYTFFVYDPKKNMPDDIIKKYGDRYHRKVIDNFAENFAEMQKKVIQMNTNTEVKKPEIDMNKFKEDVNKFIDEDCKDSERYTQKLEMFAYFLIKYPMYKEVDIKDFEKIFEENNYIISVRVTKKNIRLNAINGIVPNYEFFIEMENSGMINEYDLSKAKSMKDRVKIKKLEVIKDLHAKNEEDKKQKEVIEEKKEESDNKVIPIKPQNGGLSEMPKVPKQSLKIEPEPPEPVAPTPVIPPVVINQETHINKKTCEYLLNEANRLSDELNSDIEYARMKSIDNIIHYIRRMDLNDEFLAKMFFKTIVLKRINEIKNASTLQEIIKAFNAFVDEKSEISKYHK